MSASALFFLPETHHRALPATIEEMEKTEGVKIKLENNILFLKYTLTPGRVLGPVRNPLLPRKE